MDGSAVGAHDLVAVGRGDTVLLLVKDRIADLKTLLADERLTAEAAGDGAR